MGCNPMFTQASNYAKAKILEKDLETSPLIIIH
jgi:hypothetical protein